MWPFNLFTRTDDLDSAKAYLERGVTFEHDLRRAIADFNRAIKLDSTYSEAYYCRGAALGQLGKQVRAIQDYTRAIELNPDYADAYANRGAAHALVNEDQRAVSDFDRTIQLEPRNAQAYYGRALSRYALGRHSDARDDFDIAERLGTNRPEMLKEIAHLRSELRI